MLYHQAENTTAASNATNATDAGGAAGPPVDAPGGGIAHRAIDGVLNGLDVASRFAGDIVRSVVPESVIESIPFLVIDATGGCIDVLGGVL